MIIQSILDNDYYKFLMQRAVFHNKLHETPVRYQFINRRKEGKFNQVFLSALRHEIESMANLKITEDECKFLQQDEMYPAYIATLKHFRYDPSEVSISLENGELSLEINGKWGNVILWEVPLMAIISELYFIHCDDSWEFNEDLQKKRIREKAEILAGIPFSDFGTRRRRNSTIQDLVVRELKEFPNFLGTSNVYLAHKYNTKPIGTMAHEWFMAISAIDGLEFANKHAIIHWTKTFGLRNCVFLADTYGSDAFFKDFNKYDAGYAKGVRHDSGDPMEFAAKAIAFYEANSIDPKEKTIVFSDGLTPEKAKEIHKKLDGRIKTAFGIGTNLTNDFPRSKPLNMVIKMTRCNDKPVVKLSDVPGKESGEPDAVKVAQWIFRKTPFDPVIKCGTAVIIVKDNKVLTGIRKNSHGEGARAFPGGHVEIYDKTLQEAGEREVLEETGIVAKVRDVCGSPDVIATYVLWNKDRSARYVTIYLIADYISGGTFLPDGNIASLEPEKFDRWEWFTFDELCEKIEADKKEDASKVWIPVEQLQMRRHLLNL